MFKDISMRLVDREFYTKQYELSSNLFEGETVYLYAECSGNPDRAGSNKEDFYYLEILFSVGNNSDREFIFGTYFGEGPMQQGEIDEFVHTWARAQLGVLPDHVKNYKTKERLWKEDVSRRLGVDFDNPNFN